MSIINLKNSFLVIFIAIIFMACKNKVGCFTKAGSQITVSKEMATFTSIDINNNIDVKLVNKGKNGVQLTIGENLVGGIKFSVIDGVLKIENKNSCFWFSGYTHPLVTIRNSALNSILQRGYGNIFSSDTLTIPKLNLRVEGGSGEVELIVKSNYVWLETNNIAPVVLSGKTNYLEIFHNNNNGILFAKNLTVNTCKVVHNGLNRIEINVKKELFCEVTNFGSVHLYGQRPNETTINCTDQGEIIEMF